jgi:Undecaprenyl-phosphate glucose phosphotransferase
MVACWAPMSSAFARPKGPVPRDSAPNGDEPWVEQALALRDAMNRREIPAEAPAPSPAPAQTAGTTLPTAETQHSDRRGRLRPGKLVSLRSRLHGRVVARSFRAVDGAVIGLTVVGVLQANLAGGLLAASVASVAPYLLGALLLVWSLGVLQGYDLAPREGLTRHLVRVASAFGVTAAGLAAVLLPLHPAVAPLDAIGAWFCASFVALYALHATWWLMARHWRRTGRLTPNIVIVGATPTAKRMIEAAASTGEAAVIGIFDDRADRVPKTLAGVPVLGDTQALLAHRVMPYVDRIVITVAPTAQNRVRQLIETLRVMPNEVSLVMEVSDPTQQAQAFSRIADTPLARVSGESIDMNRAAVKRLQDLAVGALALALGAPLMLLVAWAIKKDSPGPVFFRQRRHGFNNEEILVWKFRSMRQEASDYAAVRQVSADDDRVTKVGKFIRKTSLDELPQLFNVLAGEMSLVGPRPHAVGMKTGQTESARLVAEYAHRHRMKPGMTGWAAIHGSRGPVDTPELVRRRVALDIEYIERQSFWLDLYIMAMTIPCLLGDTDAVR